MSRGALDDLAQSVRACVACPELAATRTQVVPGEFAADARLLFVGEAPGATEDVQGKPFVGKGGALLDQLLVEAGLRRADVAVSNVVKCRPPANRTPTRAEVDRCRPWLDVQLELLSPDVVVTLGTTAMSWALGKGLRLRDVRGRTYAWRGRTLLATYHPSAAMRFGPNGEPMAALRADLQLAARVLEGSLS